MIPIVFSTDHNYVIPTGVTILSLLKASYFQEYDIYVIASNDVTEEDKCLLIYQVESVSTVASIQFLSIGNDFIGGYEVRGISKACYYRLLIPWLLPMYDKVIYSDSDIIFKADLSQIYETEMGENLFCGVNTNGFKDGSLSKYIKRLGLNPNNYINSGFLIINSQLNRKENLDKEFKKLAKKKFLFQDQDIINIIGKDRIGLIDEKYNLSPNLSLKTEGYVIHYTGIKPWEGFTYRWIEWWNMYNSSIFYDDEKYFEVSSNILNPKIFIKRIGRSIKYNIQKRLR